MLASRKTKEAEQFTLLGLHLPTADTKKHVNHKKKTGES